MAYNAYAVSLCRVSFQSMLSVVIKFIVLIVNAECHYAERHFAEFDLAECHYAKCRYAEGRGTHNVLQH